LFRQKSQGSGFRIEVVVYPPWFFTVPGYRKTPPGIQDAMKIPHKGSTIPTRIAFMAMNVTNIISDRIFPLPKIPFIHAINPPMFWNLNIFLGKNEFP
jgi:hypothetical protein